MYWNQYKTTNENKDTKNENRHFLKSNFLVTNRLFILIYSNKGSNAKSYKTKRCYLPKGIIKNYNVIINENKTN